MSARPSATRLLTPHWSRPRSAALTALVLLAGGMVAAPGSPAAADDVPFDNKWELTTDAGHIDSQLASENDSHPGPNLCEGINGIPFGGDPGWVRVNGSPNPATPFVVGEGQILPDISSNYPNYPVGNDVNDEQGGFKTNPFVTSTDAPYAHFSHDVNAFFTPDPAYRGLLATGNFTTGERNERGAMEVEWERGGIPMYAFPAAYDRMKVWGHHIFDCGHGGPSDYRTEIHPPVGWVMFRNTSNKSDRDLDPVPPSKRDQQPWHWYESADHQGIGTTLPSTALGNTPVQATVADSYFSSWGGQVVEHLNGCHDQTLIPDETTDAPCYENFGTDSQWASALLNQDYDFFVPAPPAPAGGAAMVWEAVDHCADVPANPGNPPGDNVEDVSEADSGDGANNIGSATCNIPYDVTEDPTGALDALGHPGIHVHVKAATGGVSYPSNHYLAFAKTFKVAWDDSPAPASRVHAYQVDVDHIRVHNDTDSSCDNEGEWVLSLTVGEQWVHPVRGHGEDDRAFWEGGAIDDDRNCITANGGGYKEYGIGEHFTIRVVPGEPIHVKEKGWDDDTTFLEDNDVNDVLPVIDDYRSQSEVPGTFESGPGRDDLVGGHTLGYRIADVTPGFPTAGTFAVGTPSYGPNADTGGSATRIAGATALTLSGTDGTAMQYHYWVDGAARPTSWQTDSAAPFTFTLGGQADARYRVEARAVSAGGIVGQTQRAFVELDTTPPIVTVPADIEVNASSLAGTIVTYTASAVDGLPGPVTFSCNPPSGSIFENGHNAPKVTIVTCTAIDAVGNEASKSFKVTVTSPFGYIPDFVALGTEWVNVGSGVVVNTGNVGAFDKSAGVPNTNGFEVLAGSSAQFRNGSKIAGQSIMLTNSTKANDFYYVDKYALSSGATGIPHIGFIPLFFGMPTVPAFTAGGTDLNLLNGQTASPGTYGVLRVSNNAKVTLGGGTYTFTDVELKPGAQVRFSGPATVRVSGRVLISGGCLVGPAAGSSVTGHDIVWYATGVDGPAKKPANAFDVGSQATITLNAYAPNGTMNVGTYAVYTGAALGKRVVVGSNALLNEDSAFLSP